METTESVEGFIAQTPKQQQGTKRKAGERRVIVDTACNACRARKSRCDGARPVCSRCEAKGSSASCVYGSILDSATKASSLTWIDVEAGEKRLGSLKQRHNALQEKHQEMLSLIEHLRTASTEEVNKLLRRDWSETTDTTGSQPIKRHQSHDDMETSPSYSGSGGSSWNTQDGDNNVETIESRQSSTVANEKMEGMVKVEGTPVDRADLTIPQSFTISLPKKEVFEIATTSYNRAIGQMFYMYTPDQVSKLMDDVFGTGDGLQNATSLGQLCAIAALGSFYADNSISSEAPKTFYSMAKMFVDDVIENSNLDGMKMCAILGFVNILTKSTMTIVSIPGSAIEARVSV